MMQVLVPFMGGITFLDYVKELPKGKREAKGATKGGFATSTNKPASAPTPPPAPAAANGGAAESSARGLPGVEEAKGGSEADAIADKITAMVREPKSLVLVVVCGWLLMGLVVANECVCPV